MVSHLTHSNNNVVQFAGRSVGNLSYQHGKYMQGN